MELDPFLEQDRVQSAQPIASASPDNMDPVASLLGDEQENKVAPPAAATVVVIDRSSDEVEKPVTNPAQSAVGDDGSKAEPVGQGI